MIIGKCAVDPVDVVGGHYNQVPGSYSFRVVIERMDGIDLEQWTPDEKEAAAWLKAIDAAIVKGAEDRRERDNCAGDDE